MRTVIFDLDGTLADTSGDLIDAANACFLGMGEAPQLRHGQDAATAVRGARAMLRLGLERLGRTGDEDEVERQYPKFLELYAKQLDTHSYLYDGAVDVLQTLDDMNYVVGVCTNKPEAMARDLLISLDIYGAFASLIGADTLPVRKPDPKPLTEAVLRAGGDPARSVLIGDTHTDRETARAANIPSVLVTFGPAGHAVKDLRPEATVDHFDELPMTVQMLIG